MLDKEEAYGGSGWMQRAVEEIRATAELEPVTKPEIRLRELLAASGVV